MKDLKIGVFAYNFKHMKTQIGIQNLCIAGYKPEVILAADPVNLNFYKSKIRISPKDMFLWHPRDLADFYNIEYNITVHNSQKTFDIIKEKNLDIGIILGARILKPIAFSAFNLGVINMHPGILPQNRGLDTIKWGILKDLPQGVTSHLINEKIDMGLLIDKKEIKIYSDDTLTDIYLRVQSLEQQMMIDSIKIINDNKDLKHFKELSNGKNYHRSVPPEIEKSLYEKFTKYKKTMGV